MTDIKINREWAMPNSNTFSIKPIRELIERYLSGTIIDPFANQNKLATITNDLDPQYDTDYHMDATDFLKMLDNNSADVVLWDPPYSPRQIMECYKKFNMTVDKLKDINNLKSNLISIGMKLKVGDSKQYVVKKGDTLWKIAKENNTTVDDLMKKNNLLNSNLQIGQILYI